MPCNNRKEWDKVLAAIKLRLFPDFKRRTILHTEEVPPARWRRHSRYFSVYLWETMDDLRRNSSGTGAEPFSPEARAYACYLEGYFLMPHSNSEMFKMFHWRVLLPISSALRLTPAWIGWERRVAPKLGEMHFAAGHWSVDLVAHEAFHAVSHVMNCIGPSGNECVRRATGPRFSTGCAQEDVAYVHGHMVKGIFDWLCESDPAGRPRLVEWELP